MKKITAYLTDNQFEALCSMGPNLSKSLRQYLENNHMSGRTFKCGPYMSTTTIIQSQTFTIPFAALQEIRGYLKENRAVCAVRVIRDACFTSLPIAVSVVAFLVKEDPSISPKYKPTQLCPVTCVE